MHHSYFNLDARDRDFYSRRIAERLPERILDAHVHMTLPEHAARVPRETVQKIWALQYGMVLPYEEAMDIAARLFPGKRFSLLAFPWPLKDADHRREQRLLKQARRRGKAARADVRPARVERGVLRADAA